MNRLQLPLSFDPERLRGELDAIAPSEWVAHFNRGGYDGDWSGVALRAVGGDAAAIYPDPTALDRYADTAVLERTPYLREVLSAFPCPLTSVRLLKLGAGSDILEHRDHRLSSAHGEVRIHVPIVTNELVAFYLDGERVVMGEGEAWYLDLELPHRVTNTSDQDRVHLVIDCVVDEWLTGLLLDGAGDRDPTALPERSASGDDPPDRRERPLRPPVLSDPTAALIAEFLHTVGLPVTGGAVDGVNALPGITVDRGWLVVDDARLRHPGDLLHEGGHLAVMGPTARRRATGNVPADGAEEMMAIGWSYAAALHLGVHPSVVFHSGGYRGGAEELLAQFAEGRYLAVPMLQWLGMTYDADQARARRVEPYPAMRTWVRTSDEPDPPPLP